MMIKRMVCSKEESYDCVYPNLFQAYTEHLNMGKGEGMYSISIEIYQDDDIL